LASPVPVQAVVQEDIQLAGENNLADIVNDVPALIGSLTSDQSVQFSDVPDGSHTVDLRRLGPERTLVLVNARRHVPGIEGSQAVDIGSIPKGLVQRVDVLTGGASAIYGSDAVTGVINFILREDFTGYDFDLYTGSSDRGDAETLSFSALAGWNLF